MVIMYVANFLVGINYIPFKTYKYKNVCKNYIEINV